MIEVIVHYTNNISETTVSRYCVSETPKNEPGIAIFRVMAYLMDDITLYNSNQHEITSITGKPVDSDDINSFTFTRLSKGLYLVA